MGYRKVFNYTNYLNEIKPKTELGIYNRFLFALMSVHTTWENNIKGYDVVKGKLWSEKDKEELILKLKESGVGLQEQRARYIIEFSRSYSSNPKQYLKEESESWVQYRDRLAKTILGLGMAKSSFAIEMIYPNEANITCIDTHIAEELGVKFKSLSKKEYKELESSYLKRSKKNPTNYRWKFWDKKQGHNNPRYWSHVLENEI